MPHSYHPCPPSAYGTKVPEVPQRNLYFLSGQKLAISRISSQNSSCKPPNPSGENRESLSCYLGNCIARLCRRAFCAVQPVEIGFDEEIRSGRREGSRGRQARARRVSGKVQHLPF